MDDMQKRQNKAEERAAGHAAARKSRMGKEPPLALPKEFRGPIVRRRAEDRRSTRRQRMGLEQPPMEEAAGGAALTENQQIMHMLTQISAQLANLELRLSHMGWGP